VIIAVLVVAAGFGGWYLATGLRKTVPTPDVLTMTQAEAEQVLGKAGLALEIREEAFSEDVPAGRILGTDPLPGQGSRAGHGRSHPVPRPRALSRARRRRDEPRPRQPRRSPAQLTPGSSAQVFDDQIVAGEVVGTEPRIGTDLRPGATVGLLISKGPKPVRVPKVQGRKAGAAKRALAGDGLTATVSEKFSESVPDGVVISVRPDAGTVVDSGTQVELVVSKGPPPVSVPDLVDMTRTQAVKELQAARTRAQGVHPRGHRPRPGLPAGSAAGTQLRAAAGSRSPSSDPALAPPSATGQTSTMPADLSTIAQAALASCGARLPAGSDLRARSPITSGTVAGLVRRQARAGGQRHRPVA
jgi:beta-lactam-binding protein with PASTA domain